ncbi:MAG: V4R domain-containing protein [Sporomusaceae bacterium]|nr:V4R domain-containing protein [Sporomusaceae bacterium]
MRAYKFCWNLLGVEDGRPNLGMKIDLGLYRLMQFTLRDVLEQTYGLEAVNTAFFKAGKLAGAEFYDHFIAPAASLDEFIQKTQQALKEKQIGILKIEELLPEQGRVLLTIDEDLDCSGLPELDYETCVYDEGFISALFEKFTRQEWHAREIDCWCTGARTCRFMVTAGRSGNEVNC